MLEFCAALLMVSGPLKGHFQFIGIPVPDLTVVSLVMLFIVALKDLVLSKGRVALSPTGLLASALLLLFYAWVCFSVSYSSSESFFIVKLALFLVPLFCFVFPQIAPRFDLERFFKHFLMFAALTCLMFIYFFPRWRLGLISSSEYNVDVIRTMYLGVGGIASISILILMLGTFGFSRKMLGIGFFAITLFISSARAPLVFLILILLALGVLKTVAWLYSMKLNNKTMSRGVITLMLLTAAVFSSINYLTKIEDVVKVVQLSVDRIVLLVSKQQGASIDTRYSHLEFSLASIDQQPLFGAGAASYSREFNGYDGFDYPHNMFTEVLFENGAIGVALLLPVLILSCLRAFQVRNLLVISILLFLLMNSLKSFSFVENRQLFFFLGLALSLSLSRKMSGADERS